jgi:hypothetical protein
MEVRSSLRYMAWSLTRTSFRRWLTCIWTRVAGAAEATYTANIWAGRASIQDGKIARLSGQYPVSPLRSQNPPSAGADRTDSAGSSASTPVPPLTLFCLSALRLSATAFVAKLLGSFASQRTKGQKAGKSQRVTLS